MIANVQQFSWNSLIIFYNIFDIIAQLLRLLFIATNFYSINKILITNCKFYAIMQLYVMSNNVISLFINYPTHPTVESSSRQRYAFFIHSVIRITIYITNKNPNMTMYTQMIHVVLFMIYTGDKIYVYRHHMYSLYNEK